LNRSSLDFYFERFGFCAPQIKSAASPDLGLIVVIPCYNEPALLDSIEALRRCERPDRGVEVIVVINSGENASDQVRKQNQETLRTARSWISQHSDPKFTFHCLHFPDLPAKKAGVGLARKIGMDEALARLYSIQRANGVIVCFDADCTCDPNYLVEIERHFKNDPGSPGCSIYFEHPLEGQEDARLYEAVILYELHLRYYVEALRYAGFPDAFHTIGSSMAVRARTYLEQGGMNKRQAGEDFYFLHKIIPLGNFGEINTTRVLASPRPSDRVPFGTGRAVREHLESGKFQSYPIQAFEDLRLLFAKVPDLYHPDAAPAEFPEILQRFLQGQQFPEQLRLIREHTASVTSFANRFFRWFDGFLAMKYIHFARHQSYGAADILNVARQMYQLRTGRASAADTARDLLLAFRALQRSR